MDIWSTFIGVIKSFQVADALDVILVTFLIYKGIQFVRQTRSAQFIKAFALIVALWAVSYYLQLHMMMTVFSAFFRYGLVALIVLFQPEMRNLLDKIGQSKFSKMITANLIRENNTDEEKMHRCIHAVVDSAAQMSKTKTGALIVFERETRLNEIIATGTVLNAVPSEQMIGNIFFNKAPLHDGAMIVRDGMIYAAGCILPLTSNKQVDPSLGTRHRASLGMSENSDAVVVVVSEETGQISMALHGMLRRDFTRETLSLELESLLIPEKSGEKRMNWRPFRKEGKRK